MQASWQENWAFGIDAPLAALKANPSHPLSRYVAAELDALPSPQRPNLAGFEALRNPGAVLLKVGGWLDIGFDVVTGAITTMTDRRGGGMVEWASESQPLALLRYETLLDDDFRPWRTQYLKEGVSAPLCLVHLTPYTFTGMAPAFLILPFQSRGSPP